MMSSRGMGAINPKKVPKAKAVKMAEGDLVDDVKVKPNYAVINPDFKAAGARFSAKKTLGKDSDIEAYMDVNAMKAKDRDFQAKPGKVGLVYNKRFAEGGEVKANPMNPKNVKNPENPENPRNPGMKEGGKVNAAGNYTKPGLRKRIFNSIKAAAVQGTGAGQWSARKAQLMAKRYKAAGGGYKD